MQDNLKIIHLKCTDILPYIADLSQLRMTIFRDYPYIYEGDLAYEENYLNAFTKCNRSILIVVFDADKIVGAASALPLSDEKSEFQGPFLQAGIEINKVFYFSEFVLLKEYRGRGIGKRFFTECEAVARDYGHTITSFSTVERPDNHALRPINWQPLDKFWQRLGYCKQSNLVAEFSWKDIGDNDETFKPMVFWLKYL